MGYKSQKSCILPNIETGKMQLFFYDYNGNLTQGNSEYFMEFITFAKRSNLCGHRLVSGVDTDALYKYAYYYEYDALKQQR